MLRTRPKPAKQKEPRVTVWPGVQRFASTAVIGSAPVVSQPKGAATRAKPVTNKIRESARGEECTVRIVGVCTHDPETTIWSHARHAAAGKGRGIKALDLAGAYACTACDAAYDTLAGVPHMTREQVDLDWFHGHLRSLVRLAEKGLI